MIMSIDGRIKRARENGATVVAIRCGRTDDSRVWVDGEPTDQTLGGICGIEVVGSALPDMTAYAWLGPVEVIAGYGDYVRGEDDGEVVVPDAEYID